MVATPSPPIIILLEYPQPPPSTSPLPHTPQEEMAVAGYRTLCISERELSAKEYQAWSEQYKAASVALTDREAQLARVSERIEVEMDLLGATAVEDKLQVRAGCMGLGSVSGVWMDSCGFIVQTSGPQDFDRCASFRGSPQCPQISPHRMGFRRPSSP